MTMRKFTGLLAGCVVGVLAFRVWAYTQLTATKSSATPATIVYLVKDFDEKGNPAPSDILVRAYRSDGSHARYMLNVNARPPIRSVIDYERRVQASIDPLIKAMIRHSITQGPWIPTTCEGAWGPGHCLGPVGEKISGFSLERVSRKEPGGDEYAYWNEFLVAPALDYRPLKRTLTTSGGSVVQEWTAIDVRLGEPDPALFEIPEDYEVVSRDVYYQRGMEARSRKADPDLVERFRALEEGRRPVPGCKKQD